MLSEKAITIWGAIEKKIDIAMAILGRKTYCTKNYFAIYKAWSTNQEQIYFIPKLPLIYVYAQYLSNYLSIKYIYLSIMYLLTLILWAIWRSLTTVSTRSSISIGLSFKRSWGQDTIFRWGVTSPNTFPFRPVVT